MASRGAGISLPRKLAVWPIDDLIPYERNARTHSPEQVEQIVASIREFGFNSPILVSQDKGILAGHGRLEAARQLGMTEVPVVPLDHLTPEQQRAYILADNRIAQNAGWDHALLSAELAEIDFDHTLLGFDDADLKRLSDSLQLEALEAVAQGRPKMEGDESEKEKKERREKDEEEGGDAPTYYAFTLSLTYEDRDVIFQCLNKIKSAERIESSADALLFLARYYQSQNP